MPGPMGGFGLSDVLQQYHQADSFVQGIKKRREQREEEEKDAANPLPKGLIKQQQFREAMGPNYQDDPEVQAQIEATVAPKGGWRPGQLEQFRKQAAQLPSHSQQNRILRFKADLGKKMEEINDRRIRDMVTEQALQQAVKEGGQSPDYARGVIDTNKRALADAMASIHSTMQTGYEDVWNHPEVQAALKDAVTKGILGPSPSITGQAGGRWMQPGNPQPQVPQMPNTQLPNLQLRGLLGQ